MSNGRRIRRRLGTDEARSAATAAAIAQGCTCRREVEVVEYRPGLLGAVVRHDPLCPLLQAANAYRN